MIKKSNYPIVRIHLVYLISPAVIVLLYGMVDLLFISKNQNNVSSYLPTALIVGGAGYGFPATRIAAYITRNSLVLTLKNLLLIAIFGGTIYFITTFFWVLFALIFNLDLMVEAVLPLHKIFAIMLLITLIGSLSSIAIAWLTVPRKIE